MSNVKQVIDNIAAALANSPYKVLRDVDLPDGSQAAIIASRTYFSWKDFVFLSQYIVIRHIDNATPGDTKTLFDTGFHYAKKINRVPLFRGLQFGYMVIPVIVGNTPDSSLIDTVTQRPTKHWSLFEYPIVVDLGSNQTHRYTGTPMWGAFYFSDMRQVAEKYIDPSLAL